MRKLYILGLIGLAGTIGGLVFAETITLTTYYPAPYGVYNDMVVMNSLGIGTTAPDYKLDVSSSDTSNTFAGSATIKITNTETTAFGRHQSLVFGYNNIAGAGISGIYNNWGATNRGGHILAFYTKNSATEATPQEKMRIDKNGNVGIGTTSPGAKLEVSGGYVLVPDRPAFSVSLSAHWTTQGVMLFNVIGVNNGNHYSSSTGRFTAPIGGLYQICFGGMDYPAAGRSYADIHVNGVLATGGRIYSHGGPDYDGSYKCIIVNLNAGDYVNVYNQDTTGQGWYKNPYVLFSGHLL